MGINTRVSCGWRRTVMRDDARTVPRRRRRFVSSPSRMMLLIATSLCLILAEPPLAAAAGTGTSTSTEIIVSIVGAVNLNTSEMRIMNITLWGEYPMSLSDTVYYDIATFLNGVNSGTTSPPSSTGARRSGNSTSSSDDGGSESLAWYWIMLIVLGGTGLLVAIILAIYYGVRVNSNNNNKVHPGDPPLLPDAVPDAYRVARFVGLPVMSYPPPHAYSKVIQIPLVRPMAPPSVHTGVGAYA